MKSQTHTLARGIEFPADASVRDRIKGGEQIAYAERGEMTRYPAGAQVSEADLPAEVLAACRRRGLFVEEENAQSEEDAE